MSLRCLPVSPHDEFAPTSTELDRVRPQTDRVRPQTDCVPFHVSEVLNSIVNSIDMKVDQTLACSILACDVVGSR